MTPRMLPIRRPRNNNNISRLVLLPDTLNSAWSLPDRNQCSRHEFVLRALDLALQISTADESIAEETSGKNDNDDNDTNKHTKTTQ